MSLWLTIGLQVAWQGVQNILTGRVVLCKGQVHPPYRRRLPSAPPPTPAPSTNVINGRLIGLGVVLDSEPRSHPFYQSFPILSSDNETLPSYFILCTGVLY